jgi:hypothetical protein
MFDPKEKEAHAALLFLLPDAVRAAAPGEVRFPSAPEFQSPRRGATFLPAMHFFIFASTS